MKTYFVVFKIYKHNLPSIDSMSTKLWTIEKCEDLHCRNLLEHVHIHVDGLLTYLRFGLIQSFSYYACTYLEELLHLMEPKPY